MLSDSSITTDGNGNLSTASVRFTTGSISRISRFSSTGTGGTQTIPHGLGSTPDLVLLQYAGNFGSPPGFPIAYWNTTSSQVSVKAASGYFYWGLAIKF